MESDESASKTVSLTDDAADVITSLLREQGYDSGDAGMRISIERGGCAGLTYRFDLRASPEAEDIVCGTETASLFVDKESTQYLAGAELDVDQTAHGIGFCIENPNAVQQCGCGISFRATD